MRGIAEPRCAFRSRRKKQWQAQQPCIRPDTMIGSAVATGGPVKLRDHLGGLVWQLARSFVFIFPVNVVGYLGLSFSWVLNALLCLVWAQQRRVRALEKTRSSGQLQANYSSSDNSLYTNPKGSTISAFDGGSDSSSESELEEPQSRKKLRMEAS